MAQKHFIRLKLGSETYKGKVSSQGCSDVDDFRDAIKTKFSPVLDAYAPIQLTLFEPDGITEIDPETPVSDLQEVQGRPMVVTVKVVGRPEISTTRHQDYKQSKAFTTCRSFLTSIALELDEIYPIKRERTATGTERPVTFGTILNNAYKHNPEPFPEFRNEFSKLKGLFTKEEWKFLDSLNETVNNQLHAALNPGSATKHLLLPSAFSGTSETCQIIAKKARIVAEASDLIVKNEGSISGGSPISDRSV